MIVRNVRADSRIRVLTQIRYFIDTAHGRLWADKALPIRTNCHEHGSKGCYHTTDRVVICAFCLDRADLCGLALEQDGFEFCSEDPRRYFFENPEEWMDEDKAS